MRPSFRPSWHDPRFREEARPGIQEDGEVLDFPLVRLCRNVILRPFDVLRINSAEGSRIL